MTSKITLRDQLILIPASLVHLSHELDHDYAALFAALGVSSPPYWPPELNDDDSFGHFLALLKSNPDAAHWGANYIAIETGDRRCLVGFGGFVAPPDEAGVVEIGYSVLTPFRRQGIATELCRRLTRQAFAEPRVTKVIANTLPGLIASIGVLEKAGFCLEGETDGIVRYGLVRPTI